MAFDRCSIKDYLLTYLDQEHVTKSTAVLHNEYVKIMGEDHIMAIRSPNHSSHRLKILHGWLRRRYEVMNPVNPHTKTVKKYMLCRAGASKW